MPLMRRVLLLLLIFIIPIQYAWTAALAAHVHPLGTQSGMHAFTHTHGHDHHDAGHADHDLSQVADADQHNDDNHHGSHCHHVLSPALLDAGPLFGAAAGGGGIEQPVLAFHTRIPPLLDRPPLARA